MKRLTANNVTSIYEKLVNNAIRYFAKHKPEDKYKYIKTEEK